MEKENIFNPTEDESSTLGNNFKNNGKFFPLYNSVLQTCVSNVATAAIVGTLVGFTALVCLVGIAYACRCSINIKILQKTPY